MSTQILAGVLLITLLVEEQHRLFLKKTFQVIVQKHEEKAQETKRWQNRRRRSKLKASWTRALVADIQHGKLQF